MFSKTIVVQVSNIGIEETVIADITLFPDPTKVLLFIESQEPIEKVEVFDITGRLVFTPVNPENQINLSILNTSVHFGGSVDVKDIVRH